MNYVEHANGIRAWPTLYKLTKGGKGQQWDIRVVPTPSIGDVLGATTVVEYGQIGGKIQQTSTFLDVGKNVGKKNETSPLAQAISEADAKWVKQKDKGYSEQKGGAILDLKPMLAHKYEDEKEKVKFPAYLQPKLDGMRCIAHRMAGVVHLWSRGGKAVAGLNHVRTALLDLMREGDILDGELYTHGIPFQTLSSYIKKDREESKKVEYHVYDMLSDKPFANRYQDILHVIFRAQETGIHAERSLTTVCLVPTIQVYNAAEVEEMHATYVERGYEGVMLRAGDCVYRRGYRSRELLKVKAFQEAEFTIVDVVPGVGRMADQGIFVCKTNTGRTFNVKPKGRDASRQEYLEKKADFVGKQLTVTYFSMTDGDDPVPRFPVGKCVRDYEGGDS